MSHCNGRVRDDSLIAAARELPALTVDIASLVVAAARAKARLPGV